MVKLDDELGFKLPVPALLLRYGRISASQQQLFSIKTDFS